MSLCTTCKASVVLQAAVKQLLTDWDMQQQSRLNPSYVKQDIERMRNAMTRLEAEQGRG